MKLLKTCLMVMVIISTTEAAPSCLYEYHGADSSLVCSTNEADNDCLLTTVFNTSNTKSIVMNNCRICDVNCGAFRTLQNLNKIDLSGNRLQNLRPCILDGLSQLTSLNLSYNLLNQLPKGLFPETNSIEVLDLKGNQIKTIKEGVFEKLNNLKELDLSYNALQSSEFTSHLFDHNKLMKFLDFSRNDMSSATEDLLLELQWLETLNLDRCFLTKVPSFATKFNMKTLKTLILSTNDISTLNSPSLFVNLDNLEILNLAGNSIENIAENIFAPLRKVKTIVLKHNHLKQLSEKLFQNIPKLVSVDISYNNIQKIQTSTFRNTPMKNLNLSGNKLTYLPEKFCQELRNSGGRLKKLLFSTNPWQCACLRDIMEEVKALEVTYDPAKYSGNEGVCVSGKHFTCVRD